MVITNGILLNISLSRTATSRSASISEIKTTFKKSQLTVIIKKFGFEFPHFQFRHNINIFNATNTEKLYAYKHLILYTDVSNVRKNYTEHRRIQMRLVQTSNHYTHSFSVTIVKKNSNSIK